MNTSWYALCCLALLQAFIPGSSPLKSIPYYFQKNPFTCRQVSVFEIAQDLGAVISSNSAIFLPSHPPWSEVTKRWNTLIAPDIEIVVQPAEESDIPKVVQYCNDNGIEFLVVNRGHGLTAALNKFRGIQIDMKQLTAITIDSDGKSALFQGGVSVDEVVTALWDQGYVTTTGSSGSVGLTGLALGGGHGRYEGLYGLISDNVIHLNVVLADGSTVPVNETSYEDLFWAMKGAGHNFGIVTSLRLKIYPKQIATWHYHNYLWTQDKLEAVFEEMNRVQDHGNAPPLLGASFGHIRINRSVNEKEAILWWTSGYAGPASEVEHILRPFNAIEAISDEMGDVPYPEIHGPQDTATSSFPSGPYVMSTVMLQTYNITAQRQLYDLFNRNAALYPELGANALLMIEGYATAGVQAIDPISTAYPHRDEFHLAFFLAAAPEGSDLLEPARTWAKESWDIWNAGQPTRKPATYVNYGTGNEYESLESIYGYEPWRLERLRALKAKYDPYNRFRYYVPIIPY
ncbi:FAD-binding domain-containing protein [Hypoxylon rubiginosum]|uniref:FAD-binding domain-containing protein n=1 Tax=Hypoxylon rubiginosum TaxID=110542 RepID=A0ACC0CXG8_9PEZI|nr:FAD-binding domain-containing protein [Hypoxylon rubiginosum]